VDEQNPRSLWMNPKSRRTTVSPSQLQHANWPMVTEAVDETTDGHRQNYSVAARCIHTTRHPCSGRTQPVRPRALDHDRKRYR
jgi:hypothetical protein